MILLFVSLINCSLIFINAERTYNLAINRLHIYFLIHGKYELNNIIFAYLLNIVKLLIYHTLGHFIVYISHM